MDRLALKWDDVPLEKWEKFLKKLESHELNGDIPEVRATVGRGYGRYHWERKVGEGEGAVMIGYGSNADRDKEPLQQLRLEWNPQKSEDWTRLVTSELGLGMPSKFGRIDLACDVETETFGVFVFPTNGQGMRYIEGTRYFGYPGKDGALKVYDKAAERGIEGTLTRVEYLWSPNKPFAYLGEPGFERRYRVYMNPKVPGPEMRAIVYAVNRGEVRLEEFSKYKRKKIKEALAGHERLEPIFNKNNVEKTLRHHYIT